MEIQLGIVMDPITEIKVHKNGSFAMLLAAQARGWTLWYMEMSDLWLRDGQPYATMKRLEVHDNAENWFTFTEIKENKPLAELNIILMRKDPPFDMEYITATYVLERAEIMGVTVINKPQSLRDANEKAYTAWFPQCCPPTLLTRQLSKLREFLQEQQQIVVKPLDSMGGTSIFYVHSDDVNRNVIFETITYNEQRFVIAQRYIPEIKQGDKRILLIDGEPLDYVLRRVPAQGEFRGNMVAGAEAQPSLLTDRERWICEQLRPVLQEKGLFFVGIDVIGDYLTEINVTSPTGIRELDKFYQIDIAGQMMDKLYAKLKL